MNSKKLFLSLLAFGALVVTGCSNGGSQSSSSSSAPSSSSSEPSSSSQSSSSTPTVKDMTISAEKTSIEVDESLQLFCSQENVLWTTDSKVVSLTSKGKIKGLTEGTAIIKANKTGYKEATITITVVAKHGPTPAAVNPYVLYGKLNGASEFTEYAMTQSSDPEKPNEYYLLNQEVKAGDIFVFQHAAGTWFKFNDIDDISVGLTSTDTDNNIIMNYDGTYDFYIGFNTAGKNVSIVKHHSTFTYDPMGSGDVAMQFQFKTVEHDDRWVVATTYCEKDLYLDIKKDGAAFPITVDPDCSGKDKVHVDSTYSNRLILDYDGSYSFITYGDKLIVEYSEAPVGVPNHVLHMCRAGQTNWTSVDMPQSTEEGKTYQYELHNYAMTAGDEFVFHYEDDVWYNFNNLMPDSQTLVSKAAESDNIVMNVTGVYDFYIGFGSESEPHVSIVKHEDPAPTYDNYIMRAKLGENDWDNFPLSADLTPGKEGQYYIEKDFKQGDILCFHYTGNTWYKYGDVDGISIGMVNEDSDGNIVVNFDGNYRFYVGFTNDQNKHVSIVKNHDDYQYSIDGGVNKSSMTFQYETDSHPDQWVVAEGEIAATAVLSIYKNDVACDVVLTDDCTGKTHVTVLNNTITINDGGYYSFLVSGDKLNLSYRETPAVTPNHVMHINKTGTTTWVDVNMTQSTEVGKEAEYVLTGYDLKAGDVLVFHYSEDIWYGYSDIQTGCVGQVDPVENSNDIKIKEDGKYDFYVGLDVEGKHIYLAKETVQVPNHSLYGKINGGTTWEAIELIHSSDSTKPNEYFLLNVEMKAGDTFVFHYEDDTWYNFNDCDALSTAVVEKAGGVSNDIVIKADGFYDIYIGFTNGEGKHVSIIPHVEKPQYAVSIPDGDEPTKIDLVYVEESDTYEGLITGALDNDVVTFYTKTSEGYAIFGDNIEVEADGYVAGYKNNLARTKNPSTGEYTNTFYILKGSQESLEISIRIVGDKKVVWVSGGEEIVTVPDHSLYGKVNGSDTWTIVPMTQSAEEGKTYQYEIHDIDLKVGDEFVFHYEGETWYHYTDCDASARQYVEAGDNDNIVVTASGNYNIYIGFTSGEGKHVSITKNVVQLKHYVYIGTEQILEMTKNSSNEYVLENIALKAGDELSFTEGTEVLQVTPKEDINDYVNNVRVGTPSYYLVVLKALTAAEGQGIYLDPTTNKVWVSGNTVSYSIGKKGEESKVEFGPATDKGTFKEYAATLTDVVAGEEYVINKSIYGINVVAEDNAGNNAVSTADGIKIRQSGASVTVYLKVYPAVTNTYGCWVTGYDAAKAVYQMYDTSTSTYVTMTKTGDTPGFAAQYTVQKELEAMSQLSFAIDYKSIGIYKDAADTNNICVKEGILFVHNYAENANVYLKVPESGNSCVYIDGRKAFSEYALKYTIDKEASVGMNYVAATQGDPEQWKALGVNVNTDSKISLGSSADHIIPLVIENTDQQVSGCIDVNESNSQGVIVITAPCTLDIYAKDNDGILLVWLTVTPAV